MKSANFLLITYYIDVSLATSHYNFVLISQPVYLLKYSLNEDCKALVKFNGLTKISGVFVLLFKELIRTCETGLGNLIRGPKLIWLGSIQFQLFITNP